MEPVIELRNITKRFDMRQESSSLWRFLMRKPSYEETHSESYKVVLDDISLTINQGERLAIIGRNGAGKSTLLKIISRILLPDSGTVAVRGTISSLLELGVGFHPELSGSDNIYFYGALMGKNRAQVRDVYDEICDFADIGNYIQQPVKTYSSGMYQRLAFSCAFAMQPNILIADEGLSVGDFMFQQKCFDRIDQIVAEGTTFLMVAHSARQVQRIATRGIWLENGRIEMDSDINSVQDAYTKFLLYEKSLLVAESEKNGTTVVPGIELTQRSGDTSAVSASQSMVEVTKVEPLSGTDPWRIGVPTEINYHITVRVPKITLRTRVVITDVADDLPLVENLYLKVLHTLTEGDHVLRVSIPPIHFRSGTYTCKFEIYEDESEMLLASAEPIMLSSKRRLRHKESAYMRHTRLKVTVQSNADNRTTDQSV
jgi:ABC-type polysaccharide/polyol phosphate transport system ATPase subunit